MLHTWDSSRQDSFGHGQRNRVVIQINGRGLRRDRKKEAHYADAKGYQTQDGRHPMNLVFCRPSIPEESDGEQGSKPYSHSQSHLWLKFAIVRLGKSYDGFIGVDDDEKPPATRASSQREVHKSGHTDIETIRLLESGWERRKKQVKRAVCESDIDGQKQDDG